MRRLNYVVARGNLLKLSKIVKIVKKKNCQNVGQVMFPHHSDKISQKSQVSSVALCLSKVKVLVPGSWVTCAAPSR